MKITSKFLAFIILFYVMQMDASAIIFVDRPGFYLSGSGSVDWNIACDCGITIEDAAGSVSTDGASRPRTGFNVNLAGGYYLDQWRLEVEGSYRSGRGNANFNFNGITVKDFGFLSTFAAMANVYYDVFMTPCSGFHLGAGVGVGISEIEVSGLINDSVRDARFAYQLMVGLFYKINCAVAATLSYRFFGTTAPEDIFFRNNNITVTVNSEGSPITQSIELGLRVSL